MDKAWGYLIAFLLVVGIVGSFQYLRSPAPGSEAWITAKEDARARASDWPQRTGELAEMMIDRHGPPDRITDESMVWLSRRPWKRIVVHREPEAAGLEQVVAYDVPAGRIGALRAFALGRGIEVDALGRELGVTSGTEALNILVLNIADEVAGGRREPDEAERFLDEVIDLWTAGKSTAYCDALMFTPPPEYRSYRTLTRVF